VSRTGSLNGGFSLTVMSGRGDLRPDSLEICEGVHVRPRALERLLDINPQAVFERTQLLELLALLEHPAWQLRETQECGDTVGIDTAMTARTGSSSSSDSSAVASVAMSPAGCAGRSRATCAIATAGMSGSSPCTFTTISCAPQLRERATSAMRSVPEACVRAVMMTSAPNARAALAIRSSSVAMNTSRAPADEARS